MGSICLKNGPIKIDEFWILKVNIVTGRFLTKKGQLVSANVPICQIHVKLGPNERLFLQPSLQWFPVNQAENILTIFFQRIGDNLLQNSIDHEAQASILLYMKKK